MEDLERDKTAKVLREPVHLIQPPINSINSHSVRSLTMLRRIQTPASDSGRDLRNRTVAYTDRYATVMSKCVEKNRKADRRTEKRAVVSGPPSVCHLSVSCYFLFYFFYFHLREATIKVSSYLRTLYFRHITQVAGGMLEKQDTL